MNYRLGDPLDYDPFVEDEDSVVDSPTEFSLGEALEINPFEADPYENDPQSSDIDETDDGGHSLWDIPRMMGKGAAGMAKTAGMVQAFSPQELATKAIGFIGDLTENETFQAIRDYTDEHGVSAKLSQYGETAEQYYDEKLTPAMKASMKKTILASGKEEGFWGEGLKDPWKIGGMIAESIPSTIISMGGSAIITKGLIQTGFKSAPKIVQGVLGKMVKKYGINSVAGVIGGAIGEGGYSGMENANQAFEEMMATPQGELQQSETYQEIFNSLPASLSDDQKHGYARKILAMATGGFVGSITAVTTGILGAPSGAFLGKLIGGEAGKSLWGNLLKGAFTEGFLEEAPQSGMERLVTNFTQKMLVDPNQELLEGVGEAMAAGAVTGAFMGMGMAGIAGREGKKHPITAKDILTDGQDITAEDILLGTDEAERIRKKVKGKKYGGAESIEAEEEAGEFAEEDLEALGPSPLPDIKLGKPKPKIGGKYTPEKEAPGDRKRGKGKIPSKKPQGEEPKPTPPTKPGKKKAPPSGMVQKPEADEGIEAPEGDRRKEVRPGEAERREDQEREPPPWDKDFRTYYLNAKKMSESNFMRAAQSLYKKGTAGIEELARRMGAPIEADTDLDSAFKMVHSRIVAGMQPRKKASEMTAEELREATNTDYLTGLRNKQAFDLEDTRRAHVTSIDLDSLKYINDNFGHQTGDAMLINFGNALKTITEADTYHVSGDEFIIQGDDPDQLDELLYKRVADYLNKNPLTVITPDGKRIKYTVGFSYGTAETVAQADERLARQKEKRQVEGKRAGRGEIPPGLPGYVAKGKRPGDQRKAITEEEIKAKPLKHFTTPERAKKIRKEGHKPQAEKPIFGTGGLDKGEKTGKFAGDALYLAVDDTWSSVNRFEASGPAVPATGKEKPAETNIYYDYENQRWMAEPGAYKKEKLEGVEYNIAPDAKILTIGSIADLNKAILEFGHGESTEFWNNIKRKYDAVLIINTAEIQKADPENKFFKSVMADQLIVLNRDKAVMEGETPADTDDQAKIDQELEDLDHDPTPDQAKAGNYKKGHFKFMGFNVTIEEAPGDIRRGTAPDGTTWETKMENAYGYFSRTEGKDGDEIDLFLGDNPEAPSVYIVHQVDPKTKKPDEDKVMLGFLTPEEAKAAYLANYEKGWQGLGSMTAMLKVDFADWLNKQTKARKKKAKAPGRHDNWRNNLIKARQVAIDLGITKTFGGDWSNLQQIVAHIDAYDRGRKKTEAEKPVIPTKPIEGIEGDKTKIITPGNRRGYNAYYTIVEADDLIPSHNAQTFQKNSNYPEGIQERTYHTDTQEQGKVIQNAQHLSPKILLSDDPTPTNGPPIATASGIVLGGNSRTMSIQRAYKGKKGSIYKNAITLQASKFGFSPAEIESRRKPVLVRTVYLEKDDAQTLHRMASDFNKTLTQGVSQEAEIASMGRNISMATVEKIGLRMANRDLTIRELLGKKDGLEILEWLINDDVIAPGDKSRYINRKLNVLNEPGKIQIEKALFGSIIDDAELIDAAPKTYQNKIGRALPSLARIKARGDQWDITPDVKDALELATKAKAADLGIREFTKQGSLFGDKKEYGDVAMALAFHVEADTQTLFAKAFKMFAADAVADAKDQTHLFPPRTFTQAFEEAFHAVVKEPTPRAPSKPTIEAAPKSVAELVMMSPDEYLDYKLQAQRAYTAGGSKSDIHDEFEISYPEKVKIEETGEIVEREIDAVAYMNDIEDEITLYEELKNCMLGTK